MFGLARGHLVLDSQVAQHCSARMSKQARNMLLFLFMSLSASLSFAGRNFVPVEEAFLCEKILAAAKTSAALDGYDLSDLENLPLHLLSEKIADDLGKIEGFEPENSSTAMDFGIGSETLLGFKTLSNKLVFLGVNAGGDSTVPLLYIIYWDGKTLRAYVPKEGNTWNTDTNLLYGEGSPESDLANLRKRFPGIVEEGSDELPWDEIRIDAEKVTQDILARIIEVKP